MAENNEKKYIIKIKGKEVEVSEEVYRAYIRPIRAEQRRKRREWKCSKLSKTGGYYVRCNERCETCPYYQSGNNALGNKLSLDRMAEDGVDLEDSNQDVETKYIEEETQKEEKEKLYEAMSTLPLDDGARFKTWRETFITKIVIAYGTVFSVNIFVLLLPLITRMRIDEISGFGNSMFVIFMIVGGAMVIPAGQALFCKLFGQADDMHAGGNFLRSAFYGSRMVGAATFGLAHKIIHGGASVGKAISNHRKNKADGIVVKMMACFDLLSGRILL